MAVGKGSSVAVKGDAVRKDSKGSAPSSNVPAGWLFKCQFCLTVRRMLTAFPVHVFLLTTVYALVFAVYF